MARTEEIKTFSGCSIDEFEKQKGAKLNYHSCPACGGGDISMVYSLEGAPAHSVLLMPTYQVAVNYPKGNIYLGSCDGCGFISNYGFEPALLEYSSHCEESQGFSPTFNKFHRNLAKQLIERYNLHNKDIVEIGCGKGEFLTLLCELGNNRGVGFDPAYIPERNHSKALGRMRFVRDFYSEKYADIKSDFVCCKMTLEHIHNVFEFISNVRKGIYKHRDTVVFFQVPDVERVIAEGAFWDIYYEHCSYFSEKSLVKLFEKCDFEVINTWRDFDNQYLMIEAKCAEDGGKTSFWDEKRTEKNENFSKLFENFGIFFKKSIEKWQNFLNDCGEKEKNVVLWGSGSKAAAFLNTLKLREKIVYVVDINPYRWKTFVPGTGQEIISPEALKEFTPDVVVVMNPIYKKEVTDTVMNLGLKPFIVTV